MTAARPSLAVAVKRVANRPMIRRGDRAGMARGRRIAMAAIAGTGLPMDDVTIAGTDRPMGDAMIVAKDLAARGAAAIAVSPLSPAMGIANGPIARMAPVARNLRGAAGVATTAIAMATARTGAKVAATIDGTAAGGAMTVVPKKGVAPVKDQRPGGQHLGMGLANRPTAIALKVAPTVVPPAPVALGAVPRGIIRIQGSDGRKKDGSNGRAIAGNGPPSAPMMPRATIAGTRQAPAGNKASGTPCRISRTTTTTTASGMT